MSNSRPPIRRITVWVTDDGREFPSRELAEDWLRTRDLARWLREHAGAEPSEAKALAERLHRDFAILPRNPREPRK